VIGSASPPKAATPENALVALRVRAAVGLANAVLTGPGFDDLGPARTEEEVIALASR
jgi:hypothetical protein